MTQFLSHNFLTEPELMRLGRLKPEEREKERESECERERGARKLTCR